MFSQHEIDFDTPLSLDLNNLPNSLSYNNQLMTLEDDQFKVAKSIIAWLHQNPTTRPSFQRVAGFAGTGKTVIISYLLNNHEEVFPSEMKTRKIAVCTFTWKAALVLKSRNVDAQSIHSIFYKVNVATDGTISFERRSHYEIRCEYSMIIVDEASMVSEAIRNDIEAVGLPVLYVGDPGQ